jgi:hypothetical protein
LNAGNGELLGWLQATPLAQAMRQSLWLYPIVEIVHIAGIVLLVGSVVGFDLRLLGLSKRISVVALARHLLPWSRLGLVLVMATGVMMFSAHAGDFFASFVFRLKMVLVLLGLLNVAFFHSRVFRSVSRWDVGAAAPAAARIAAALSLVCWLAVISCGRLLAYT